MSVTWSSTDPAVVSVSGSGLLAGERPGRAQITASAGSASGSTAATVAVTAPIFHALEITYPVGVEFLSNARVNGDLNLVGLMTVLPARTLTIVETLFLRASSVLDNQGTIHPGACEKEAGHTLIGTDPCP